MFTKNYERGNKKIIIRAFLIAKYRNKSHDNNGGLINGYIIIYKLGNKKLTIEIPIL